MLDKSQVFLLYCNLNFTQALNILSLVYLDKRILASPYEVQCGRGYYLHLTAEDIKVFDIFDIFCTRVVNSHGFRFLDIYRKSSYPVYPSKSGK